MLARAPGNRHRLRLSLLAACLMAACGGGTPPTAPGSSTPAPSGTVQVTGRENLVWDQTAPNIGDLHFALYVDGATRVELPGATCAPASSGSYTCQSALPPLTTGTHTLELVAWIDAGGTPLESVKSQPLSIQVTGGTAGLAASITIGGPAPAPPPPAATTQLTSTCGIALPPAGGLMLWDSTGSLRASDAQSSAMRSLLWATADDEGWTLSGLAVHPQFAENGWIFVAQTSTGDAPRVRVLRYRQIGDTLGERAVIFQYAPGTRPARVRLSAGSGNRLYLALLADATAPLPQNIAPHPFLIRLTMDGRVSSDNPAGSVFADVGAKWPIDVVWPADGSLPWVIERTDATQFSIAPAGRGNGGESSMFSAADTPVAAQFVGQDAGVGMWMALRDGELLRFSAASAWTMISRQQLLAAPRTVTDAALPVGSRDMAMCGPAAASDGTTLSGYVMWRVRLGS